MLVKRYTAAIQFIFNHTFFPYMPIRCCNMTIWIIHYITQWNEQSCGLHAQSNKRINAQLLYTHIQAHQMFHIFPPRYGSLAGPIYILTETETRFNYTGSNVSYYIRSSVNLSPFLNIWLFSFLCTILMFPNIWCKNLFNYMLKSVISKRNGVILYIRVYKSKTFCNNLHALSTSTHLLLLLYICVRELGQNWFTWWLVAALAPSHYLNQCLTFVNWITRNRNKFQ